MRSHGFAAEFIEASGAVLKHRGLPKCGSAERIRNVSAVTCVLLWNLRRYPSGGSQRRWKRTSPALGVMDWGGGSDLAAQDGVCEGQGGYYSPIPGESVLARGKLRMLTS